MQTLSMPGTPRKGKSGTPELFCEITQLVRGEPPYGSLQVCSKPILVHNQFWGEVARYVVYEEIYDESTKQFTSPQYPSIKYVYFEKLWDIFRSGLKMYSSTALSVEELMEELSDAILTEGNFPENINHKLTDILLCDRYHPQVGKLNTRRYSLRPPIDLSRRTSLSQIGATNKYLSACLTKGAEACCIMTGCIENLTKPSSYLIKVTESAETTGLVEVEANVRFIFVVLVNSMEEQRNAYQIGRCFATLIDNKHFRRGLYRATSSSDMLKAALVYRKNMVILPNGNEVINSFDGIDVMQSTRNAVNYERGDLIFDDCAQPNSQLVLEKIQNGETDEIYLPPTFRCSFFHRLCPPFKELVNGFKVLASRMPSDYTDAFTKDNIGTMLSSIFFIYFVVFGPAITFGTLMQNQVNLSFTISLNIFSAGIFTIIYSLFAGQPLASVGPSGPGFIFETVIAIIASNAGLDYSVYRFWVGIYVAIFGLTLITMNLSPLVMYARRSLEELFSSFISVFLILKAIFSMLKALPTGMLIPDFTNVTQVTQAYLNSQKASVAAVNLFLSFLMLVFCLLVNNFKRSHFIRRTFRYWVGAFNVPLGIIFVSLIEYIFFDDYNVNKLDIPKAAHFNISTWFNTVDINKVTNFSEPVNTNMHLLALLIGFCTALLIFTETALNSVTALKPKAKKPSPFVMDHVLTVVIFPLISCSLGWPFMSGVPVRTIANTMALVKVDPHPPPGKPAEIISLVEQRVSVLIVGILVAVSVFLGDILQHIPVAALYGMFIFLGLNGLQGLDSAQAISALLTRRKYWSRWEFLMNLKTPQVAVITAINVFNLSILIIFIVLAEFTKAKYATLATPAVLIGSGLIREFILTRWKWLAPTLNKLDKRCLPTNLTPVDAFGDDFEGTCNESMKSAEEKKQNCSIETLVF